MELNEWDMDMPRNNRFHDPLESSARPAEAGTIYLTPEQFFEQVWQPLNKTELLSAEQWQQAFAFATSFRAHNPRAAAVPAPPSDQQAEQLAKHVVDECLGKYPDDDREFTDLERDIASLIRPHLRASAVPRAGKGERGE